jgi:hypothetical protein
MNTKIKVSKLEEMANRFVGSFISLVKERGIRAEFQSALGFLLLTFWLIPPSAGNTIFKDVLLSLFPQHVCLVWFFFIAVTQSVGNIFLLPRIRLYSSFLSCLTWTALSLAGIFTISTSIAVPLFISFAVAQALVFIHLDAVSGK